MDDEDRLFEELFTDELRHEQVQDMRDALEKRLAAAREGKLELSAEERAELERHLTILRQEEAIADFVEESLRAAVRRRQMLDSIDEGEGGGGEL
jgi:hypothetical protein